MVLMGVWLMEPPATGLESAHRRCRGNLISFPLHPVDAHFCSVPAINEVIGLWGTPNPCYGNLQISVWEGFYLTEASLQTYSGHSPYPILYQKYTIMNLK